MGESADDEVLPNNDPAFINEVVRPINAQDGDLLLVSAFKGLEDGTWHQGTAKYEKRGVAAFVRYGQLKTVYSATNVLMFVLTLLSARSFLMRQNNQVRISRCLKRWEKLLTA